MTLSIVIQRSRNIAVGRDDKNLRRTLLGGEDDETAWKSKKSQGEMIKLRSLWVALKTCKAVSCVSNLQLAEEARKQIC